MRRAAPYAVMAVLAFAIAILYLNLRERDLYLEALEAPPPGPVNLDPGDAPWLARPLEHDGCVHQPHLLENHRYARIRDHDGWYRLFWAGDDLYYYTDPAVFNASLQNPTARDPSGEWRVHVVYRAPNCPDRELRLRYSLVEGEEPPLEIAEGAPVPKTVPWFTGRNLRSFYWRLDEIR